MPKRDVSYLKREGPGTPSRACDPCTFARALPAHQPVCVCVCVCACARACVCACVCQRESVYEKSYEHYQVISVDISYLLNNESGYALPAAA